MSKWHKLSERMPTRNVPVLVGWRHPTAWGATWQFDVAKFGGKRWLEVVPDADNEEFRAPDCWREIEPPEDLEASTPETAVVPEKPHSAWYQGISGYDCHTCGSHAKTLVGTQEIERDCTRCAPTPNRRNDHD